MKDIKQNVIQLFEEMIALAGEGEMRSVLLSAIGFLQDEEFFDEED